MSGTTRTRGTLTGHMLRLVAILGAFALVAAACGAGDDGASRRVRSSPLPTATLLPTEAPTSPTSQPTAAPRATPRFERTPAPEPTPPPSSNLAAVEITLSRVATLSRPVAMAVRDGDPALYIAEQDGRIRRLGASGTETILDISGEVLSPADSGGGNEQGLLGMAFSPDGEYLYVDFTDGSWTTHVREYRFSGTRPEAGTAREVLTVDQPFRNHNGGDLHFGPEGHLFISLGDGGSGGDPNGNAQNTDVLLGKLLRISPRPEGGDPYGIPDDNPFVGRSGRDEIWAYGLRNPWRFSFDRATRDLWIGDVGQNAWEEVDFAPASSRGGENYGWDRLEGSHSFEGSPPSEHVLPIYEYENGSGNCAVTGGYVYRGSRIVDLRGAYVFADYCDGRLRAFVQRSGEARDHRFLGPQVSQITAFGEDGSGELYVLSREGGVYRIDPA